MVGLAEQFFTPSGPLRRALELVELSVDTADLAEEQFAKLPAPAGDEGAPRAVRRLPARSVEENPFLLLARLSPAQRPPSPSPRRGSVERPLTNAERVAAKRAAQLALEQKQLPVHYHLGVACTINGPMHHESRGREPPRKRSDIPAVEAATSATMRLCLSSSGVLLKVLTLSARCESHFPAS